MESEGRFGSRTGAVWALASAGLWALAFLWLGWGILGGLFLQACARSPH